MADQVSKELDIEGGTLPPLADNAQGNAPQDSDSEFFIHKNKALRVQISHQKDTLEGRYQIKGNEPLQDFSSHFADAFRVLDTQDKNNTNIYALVLDKRYPINLMQINPLVGKLQEGFCNILGAGIVSLSFKSGNSYVLVVQKPVGVPLFKYLQGKEALTEEFIVTHIATPINEVLSFLHSKKVMHGAINLHTIYIDENHKIYVSECVSSICGFYQETLYESLNRASCLPAAKGAHDYKSDYFALGVMINLLLLGGNPYIKLTSTEILRLKYTQGTYSMLSKNLKLSPHMLDMLRGTINDNYHEMWNDVQMTDWCKGRRFNLLPQSSRTEATRSIEFVGNNYLNRRHLANDMFLHWDEAKQFVKKDVLRKWIERSVQDTDLADQLAMIKSRTGNHVYTEGFEGADLLVASTILLLDPEGPLRFKNFSTALDGIAPLLAYACANDKNEIKFLIKCILNFGVIYEWSNLSTALANARYQYDLFALQRSADIINKKGFGFGLERCLYELNPTICCQSSQVYQEMMLSVQHLLQFLNDNNQIKGDLLDKHIAAFVANRVELPSAIRVKSLSSFPDLANHIHIQSLALYALAQQRAGIKKLPGLAEKLQTRLEEIIELFHSKKIRDDIYQQLKEPVKKGILIQILKILTNANYVYKDKSGFRNAKKAYHLKTQHILSLSNKKAIANVGYRYGLQLAVMLSFLLAAVTTLTLFARVF